MDIQVMRWRRVTARRLASRFGLQDCGLGVIVRGFGGPFLKAGEISPAQREAGFAANAVPFHGADQQASMGADPVQIRLDGLDQSVDGWLERI
jgi:hypothetical protein